MRKVEDKIAVRNQYEAIYINQVTNLMLAFGHSEVIWIRQTKSWGSTGVSSSWTYPDLPGVIKMNIAYFSDSIENKSEEEIKIITEKRICRMARNFARNSYEKLSNMKKNQTVEGIRMKYHIGCPLIMQFAESLRLMLLSDDDEICTLAYLMIANNNTVSVPVQEQTSFVNYTEEEFEQCLAKSKDKSLSAEERVYWHEVLEARNNKNKAERAAKTALDKKNLKIKQSEAWKIKNFGEVPPEMFEEYVVKYESKTDLEINTILARLNEERYLTGYSRVQAITNICRFKLAEQFILSC